MILFSSAMVFASGLACTSTITHMLQNGDHIVSMNDVYGGMSVNLKHVYLLFIINRN